MVRLKKIVIPEKITEIEYYNLPFYNNDRLETSTFNGLSKIKIGGWSEDPTILLENDPLHFQDTLISILRKECANLKSVNLPHAQKIIDKQKAISTYNEELQNAANQYNTQLKNNPYNVFNVSIVPSLFSNNDIYADAYALKIAYTNRLKDMEQDFNEEMANMEENCKQKNPAKYAEIYCSLQPELKVQLDELFHDYRCLYNREQLALMLLNKTSIEDDKCTDKDYRLYHDLFASKEEFMQAYDDPQYQTIIEHRQETNNKFKKWLSVNESFNFMGSKDNNPDAYNALRKAMNDAFGPVKTITINTNKKMFADYTKNGQYFASEEEFFDAYVSGQYKTILKTKKQK